MFCVPVTHPLL